MQKTASPEIAGIMLILICSFSALVSKDPGFSIFGIIIGLGLLIWEIDRLRNNITRLVRDRP